MNFKATIPVLVCQYIYSGISFSNQSVLSKANVAQTESQHEISVILIAKGATLFSRTPHSSLTISCSL